VGILGTLFRTLMIDRPARKIDLTDYPARLEKAGEILEERIAGAKDTPENRAQLRHIIGIERWGQSRLHGFLGEPVAMDEYDAYQPEGGGDFATLRAEFAQTREETVALARQMAETAVSRETVPHNDFGDLTLKSWLYYLQSHAALESKRIK
jgi:hypothetical protein